MTNFSFGDASRSKLVGVHPRLVAVFMHAITISRVDFKIVEGVRSVEQCWINYGKGRTKAQCLAKDVPTKYAQPLLDKVTWLNDPLASKHCKQASGYGEAVDGLPAPYDWKATGPFDLMAEAVLASAEAVGVPIRWGADWDKDGKPRERGETDSPHFELA